MIPPTRGDGPREAGVLDGLSVVEIASGISGWSAGMHLCEACADVLRIEAPQGDAASGSAQFAVLNRGKRRLSLDGGGSAALERLLAGADVLVHDLPPAQAQARGLDDAALAARHPRLVVAAIGAWPRTHAQADAPLRETLVLARLGVLDEQPGHRPGPVFIRLPFASWIAGWLCAIGAAARLIARDRDGRGGLARTSLAQAALVPMTMHWARAAEPTAAFAKGLDKSLPIPLHRCADGRWIHVHYSPDAAPWMAEALAAMGPEAVAAANAQWPPSHVAPNFGANRLIIATRPAEDWVRHFWAHDVSAQIAAPFGDIYRDEQARLNGYVVEVDDARLGRTLQPGPAYAVTPPARVKGGLRALEHAAAAHAGSSASSLPGAAPPAAGSSAPLPPLHGLKVLDLGAYLAGPFACMLLADLGADVVKVEPPGGDAMRRLERAFAGTQRGKRGVALKLGDPASKRALDALVRWADVVHHNVRMPAARKLGIDDASLRAVNPSLVFGHISAYGPVGPRADWPGFDQLMQAACGWEVESGGEGNPPMWLRFGVGDHLAALSCVFAVLLALYRRGRTGEGQAVASSLLGAMLLTASEAVVTADDGRLTPMARLDAAQAGVSAAHRLYRCADGWIAVAAAQPHEIAAWNAFAGAAPADRLATHGTTQALAALAQAGVPAAPVLEAPLDPFFDDPANAALRTRYRHAVYGDLQQVGALWDFGDLPLSLQRPPPALGEHSREVLQAVGLTTSEMDRLAERGLLRG